MLLIHGTADRRVPHTESVALPQRIGKGARLDLYEGVGHVLAMGQPAHPDRLRAFLNAIANSEPGGAFSAE